METEKLIALLETVRMKSIRKAAETIGYSQSGLTYTLNTLETDIGISLLKRDNKGIMFNERGKELEPYIRDIVEAEYKFREKIKEMSEQESQILRIGTFSSIAGSRLPDLIKSFCKENTGITVEVKIGVMDITKWLKDGTIHLGIVEEGMNDEFDWWPLFTEEMCAVVPATAEYPPDAAVSLDKLLDEPFLLHSMRSRNPLVKLLQDKDLKNKIYISTAESFAIMHMVAEGMGVSFLPSSWASNCPDSVRILPFDPPVPRQIGIITDPVIGQKLIANRSAVKKFIDYARNYPWT